MKPSKAAIAVVAPTLAMAGASNLFDTCTILSFLMPGNVAYDNSSLYTQEMNYWSALQAAQRPSCLVLPKCTKDVSTIMATLKSLQTPFTVKSGGHTAFTGGSNIDNGVTIDLLYLSQTTVSDDRKTVSIGPGARWVNVSTVLDPMKLAVLGGRDANVGVSGLLLGGGFSYFSGRHGWAADTVKKYEVVLSSGRVVYASPTENRDLYKSLRGGGGCSFGIVTRFDLEALEQGDLWANTLIFPAQLNATLTEKFTDVVVNRLDQDPDAHTYFVLITQAALGGAVALASFYHSVPPPVNQIPAVFQPIQTLQGAFVNQTVVANVTTLSKAISIPYGYRQTWSGFSFYLTSADLLNEINQVWEKGTRKISQAAGTSHFGPSLAHQPVPKSMILASQKNGGNVMNLDAHGKPLMTTHFSAEWEDATLDGFIQQTIQDMVLAAKEVIRRHNADADFVYMNYAGDWQDPLRSYGKQSYRHLKRTAQKYDPKGDLKKLWKGYFQV